LQKGKLSRLAQYGSGNRPEYFGGARYIGVTAFAVVRAAKTERRVIYNVGNKSNLKALLPYSFILICHTSEIKAKSDLTPVK